MKRFHVHLSVHDLAESTRFYTALFAAEPAVVKPDYVKWMLEDPRINFAISNRRSTTGIDHLGVQVDSAEELGELGGRLSAAGLPNRAEAGASCCYAHSDKYWTVDPQGIAWEAFHTLDARPIYGQDPDATQPAGDSCCVASAQGGGQGCGPAAKETAAACCANTLRG